MTLPTADHRALSWLLLGVATALLLTPLRGTFLAWGLAAPYVVWAVVVGFGVVLVLTGRP